MKKDAIGGTCSAHVRQNAYKIVFGNCERKGPHGRPKFVRKDTI